MWRVSLMRSVHAATPHFRRQLVVDTLRDALALQLADLLDQVTILKAEPGRLTARAPKLLGEDRHDRTQRLQALEQVVSVADWLVD
jgi:hypothetical protein